MGIKNAFGVRSHFSIGESLLKIEDIVDQAKSLGYDSVALTDTMTISGMPDFTNKCKASDIKPIIGVRLRIVDDPTYRPPTKASGEKAKDNRPWYPKLFVLKEEGLSAIFRLLTKANSEEYFYKVPRLGLADLLEELDKSPDALAFATGDVYSLFHLSDATETLEKISASVSRSNAFCELVPANTPLFDRLNKEAINASEKLGLPLLLSYPAAYIEPEDADSAEVNDAITAHAKLTDGWHRRPWLRDFTIKPYIDLVKTSVAAANRLVKRYGMDASFAKDKFLNAVNSGEQLADKVEYIWDKMPVSLPKMASDPFAKLLEECDKGWVARFGAEVLGHKPTASDLGTLYKERLDYELKVLKSMGFEDYFLLVQDLVNWSKANDIAVGPGRGSVGGSLVAYLLGITDVDPIRFNLLFERFINPERLDLPDADLDFMSGRRDEVVAYITHRYGNDRVAGISNYQVLQAASALRDVARVYGKDVAEMTFTKLVPKEHGKPFSLTEAADAVGEIDKYRKSEPAIWNHALKLEGVMRNLGRHAAGIVVAGEPIINRAVIERRKDGATVNWDKRVVEDMGLVKMDILGLSTLDLLEEAKRHIFERHGKKINLLNINLDDEKVMKAFGQGDTVGIFQFESPGMMKLLKNLAKSNSMDFEKLSAATALYRPGPMDSGLLDDYVAVAQGFTLPHYEHPNMKDALKSTYGVIVYQEQVMQLARDLAGFSMAGADHLRKAMGKKDKKKMGEQREKWVEGCDKHSGMPAAQAEALFDKIEKFAGYAFNRSHSVEYSIISYQAMWLKVHYPVEFFAAALAILGEEKLEKLVADANKRGIKVLAPDINLSSGRFEILNDKTLLVPFNRVKGLSDNTTEAIIEARKSCGGKFADLAAFEAAVEKRRCNSRHREILDKIGAFARIVPGSKPVDHPDRLRDQVELIPGLMSMIVKVERDMEVDKATVIALKDVIGRYRECEACSLKGGVHCKPRLGKAAKMMIVLDCPTWADEKEDQLGSGAPFGPVLEALHELGMTKADVYVTSVVKSPKKAGDKFLPNEAISACSKFLDEELDLLKPPVVIAMGSNSARHFNKTLKGGIGEHSGKNFYDKARDATVFYCISPGSVVFDPTKQTEINNVFKKAAELLT